MSTVAVLGAEAQIQGYALAGALPIVAETPAEACRQWAALPPEVTAVVLTRAAAAALADQAAAPDAPMTAVIPA